jgi:two-component system, OmpR family, phosphate regulon response regulator PhoB
MINCNKKILLVDDEPDIRSYLCSVLEENNFRAYTADNVQSGLQLLEESEPDLVCLDIMMPKRSGISMYAAMKENEKFRRIPVIIISGIIEEGKFDFRKFLSDESVPPPEQYLEKPIKIDEFIALIKSLLCPESREKK